MLFKNFFLFLFLILSLSIYSQQKVTIAGKIEADNAILQSAIIELQINGTSKFALSDKKGFYTFLIIKLDSIDNLFLKVNYLGYKPYFKKLDNINDNNIFNIKLTSSVPENLKEVVIKGKAKIINSARKSSYKIDSNDFIKNAKAEEVLNTVPNVYFDKIEQKAIVDGKLNAKIFIDGLEIMADELKSIEAADLDRVEVLNNPSSSYGTDFTGAILNIITKKKTEEFIKGSVGFLGGISNDYMAINPTFSYKKGRLTVKSTFNYLQNNIKIDYSSIRLDDNGSFYQSNINNSKGSQQYSQTKVNLKISEKSNLTFTNSLSGYKFIADAQGNSSLNNDSTIFFTKIGENLSVDLKISSVYHYKIKENKNFFVKTNYSTFDKSDINTFNYSDLTMGFYNIQSKNKEFTIETNYEAEELTIFKKKMRFFSAMKYINRNYSFSNTNFYINQSIINGSAELDFEWSDKFSTYTALTIENTKEFNATLKRDYSLILPTFNALYHFKNKVDANFGYSRKILRPNVNDLNDIVLIIYPGVAKQGNTDLNPQIRNYYSLTFVKAFKSNNYSLKFYNEAINNSIEEIYTTQGDLLVQTLANAAKYHSTGMNLGLRTKMFKKINANFNLGFDYNVFEYNSSTLSLINMNKGYSFRSNFNLNTKLFKDKISLSFSGRQNGPEYSLLSKRISYPYFDISLSFNALKDRLGISMYASNLLGKRSSGFTDLSISDGFYQKIDVRNNSTNLIITLTYNFGKIFDDKIEDNNIINDDLR